VNSKISRKITPTPRGSISPFLRPHVCLERASPLYGPNRNHGCSSISDSATARRLQPQLPHRNLQIGPGFLLLAGIAQQISRMVGDDELGPANGMDPSSQ